MDYIHNAVYSFMKDNGIKPNEKFRIVPDKPSANTLIGFFTEDKEFHLEDINANHKFKDKEANILIGILQGYIQIELIGRYMPTVNDRYFSIVSMNQSKPKEVKIQMATWTNSIEDLSMYAIHNCFRSENDAQIAIKNNFYGNLMNHYNTQFEEHRKEYFYKSA